MQHGDLKIFIIMIMTHQHTEAKNHFS